mmetsp:Transcript_25603/g.56016  ORF Transcript_25603/g.56016 Transcript_25603/m.56016 type:complete len:521 (-) Transcript_25603:11-1573(-)|eukprot:CAMPEP_0178657538 /NCGR_PEP_ID=MMETSP0698-20121128/25449_1 /TAXON_ID=265572 /ORGANISM="Extubocellulus spinifer, Strain CCMP396" /LENGTH=520 /DNA_ID=CAMNT_0020299743 /DNA_START=228 /DNA_END=1790 /DNA_ORIENTATION=+
MDPPPLPDPIAEKGSAEAVSAATGQSPPPADASAASTAPHQYYAVRSGKDGVVQNAIFISWADAEPHIADEESGYQSFATLEEAAAYLANGDGGSAGDEGTSASAIATAARGKRKRTKKKSATKKKKKSKTSASTGATRSSSGSVKVTRQPTEKWQQMYDRLKQYHADHQGSTRIPSADTANADLRKWLPNQKSQLGAALQRCDDNGTEPPLYLQEKVSKLAEVGIDVKNSSRAAKNLSYWNEMYASLEAFKREHGHVLVPTEKPEYSQLSTWVYNQQKEYRLYKENNPKSRLTSDLVVRLHDIGFVFERREKFLTWEERLSQLEEYKRIHGHCKVKTNDPELGQWTSKIRREYREYTEGVNDGNRKKLKISSETMEKRIRDLTEVGFVFQAGKRITLPPKHKQKSWEERFEELLQYKESAGHCIVPQSTPGLGEWVHRQRKDYKALKEGKPSKMTAERAIQLGEAGFVFDTRNTNAKAARAAAIGGLPPGVPGDESTLPPLSKNVYRYLPPDTTVAESI